MPGDEPAEGPAQPRASGNGCSDGGSVDAAGLVERGLDQVNPEERPDIRPHEGLSRLSLGSTVRSSKP